MAMYVALLRGINVGGKNLIKMTALRACFEESGFDDVTTYIQSGNVIFSSSETSQTRLTARLEGILDAAFDYESNVILLSRKQMLDVVKNKPRGFGANAAKYRYDVIFLKSPLTAAQAMKEVPTREGVDRAYAGKGVLYFSRLTSKATQSRLSKIVGTPVYQRVTIRNWNTTTKLTGLMG